MNRHAVSDKDLAALGTFQGKIERSAHFLAQAQNHNLGRNVRVVKVLAALEAMRKAGENMAGAVTCAAAIRQNFGSSNPMQAAHFLPGQLRIGARPIWELTRNPGARAQVEFWFAEVEHLPAPFNHADSEAEASGLPGGLCAALSTAVTILLRPQSGLAPIHLAYQEWQRLALDALQLAQDNKGAKPGVPPLAGNAIDGYTLESITARGQVGPTEWNRSEATRILGYYLADQRQRTWGWVTGGCQPALHEVEQLFK